MRIVFMGTPAFAADILAELLPHHEVIAVYTRPDAIRGRGKKLEPSPVKVVAEAAHIPVYCPKTLRNTEEQAALAALAPDVICVAAYGAILPREVLDIPAYGCLNVHGSLLPRWRGAAPIERALLAGDEAVGVCIMAMEEGLDTGDYCVCRSVSVGARNASELTAVLAELGAQALLTALAQLDSGHLAWASQDETHVTYAEKIAKGELDLNPADSALQNERRVRASSEAHSSRALIDDRRVTVLAAHVFTGEVKKPLSAGSVSYQKPHLLLGCADGVLEVTEVKPDGKRAMEASSFVAGIPALRSGEGKWTYAS